MTENQEQNKRIIQSRMGDFLRMHGLPLDKPFLCVNPAHVHNNNTPSMSFNEDTNKVHCFGMCDSNFDVIDMVGFLYGLDKYGDKFRKAEEIFNLPHASWSGGVSAPIYKESSFLEEAGLVCDTYNGSKLTDYTRYYNSALKNIARASDYLASRGISRSLASKYFIGCTMDSSIDVKDNYMLVIPRDKYHYSIRPLGPAGQDINGMRYKKRGRGPSLFASDSALDAFRSGRSLFVTEGEIDAMSIMTVGGLAVALCGKDFLPLFSLLDAAAKITGKKSVVIAACDNDEAGHKANRNMLEMLRDRGYESYCLDLYGSCKDANEALQENPERLRRYVTVSQEAGGLQKLINLDLYRREMSSLSVVKQLCLKKNSVGTVVPTGMSFLDKFFDGGLVPGIYVLSSSVLSMNTSFALQLADKIAMSRRDVMYISYCSSKEELCMRSMSRMLQEGEFVNKESYYNLLYRQGSCEKDYDFKSLYSFYNKFLGNNMYISDTISSIDNICDMVDIHKDTVGVSPVLFIDFLQIIPNNWQVGFVDEVFCKLSHLATKYAIPIILVSMAGNSKYKTRNNLDDYCSVGTISLNLLSALQVEENSLLDVDVLLYNHRNGKKEKERVQFMPYYSYFVESKI